MMKINYSQEMFEVSEALTSVEELVIGIMDSNDLEEIKDNAGEAFGFLHDAFNKLKELKGKFATENEPEFIPSPIKLKKIKLAGSEEPLTNSYKSLETIVDYVGMDGFIGIQNGKQALLINKDHIVSIEPVSLERW